MGHVNPYLGPEGRDWAAKQLHEAGHEPGSEVALVAQRVLDCIDNLADALPDPTAEALPIISKLITGQFLGEDEWSEKKRAEGFVWRPVLPRSLGPGDVVRVRQDAYTDADRTRHNGKQGTVSGIRHGMIYVVYSSTGAGTSMGVPHKPEALERRIETARQPTT